MEWLHIILTTIAVLISAIALIVSWHTNQENKKYKIKLRLAEESSKVRIKQGEITILANTIILNHDSFRILATNVLTTLNDLNEEYEKFAFPFPDDLESHRVVLEELLSQGPTIENEMNNIKEQLEVNEKAIQAVMNLKNPTTENITDVIEVNTVDQKLLDSLNIRNEKIKDDYTYLSKIMPQITEASNRPLQPSFHLDYKR